LIELVDTVLLPYARASASVTAIAIG
jgi:hypothetical protein